MANVEGVKVRAPHASGRVVDEDVFAGLDVRGQGVLIHTEWDAYWRTAQYFQDARFSPSRRRITSLPPVPRSSGSIRSTSAIRETRDAQAHFLSARSRSWADAGYSDRAPH
jgi:hypothetical protein